MLKLIRYLFGNLFFMLWLIVELRHLRRIRKQIRRFKAAKDYPNERVEIAKASAAWSARICKKLGVELVVESEQVLPEGPLVFVSNHESYADIPVLLAAIPDRQTGFVAKQNLRNLPLYGKWIEEIRSIFLKRDDAKSALKTVEEGIALLKDGFSLVVFPEGTRSKGKPMGDFKKGSMRLATKSGVPIVPVSLSGTWQIFEASGKIVRRATVRLYIHAPIRTAGLSRREMSSLPGDVEQIIRGKLEEWRTISV